MSQDGEPVVVMHAEPQEEVAAPAVPAAAPAADAPETSTMHRSVKISRNAPSPDYVKPAPKYLKWTRRSTENSHAAANGAPAAEIASDGVRTFKQQAPAQDTHHHHNHAGAPESTRKAHKSARQKSPAATARSTTPTTERRKAASPAPRAAAPAVDKSSENFSVRHVDPNDALFLNLREGARRSASPAPVVKPRYHILVGEDVIALPAALEGDLVELYEKKLVMLCMPEIQRVVSQLTQGESDADRKSVLQYLERQRIQQRHQASPASAAAGSTQWCKSTKVVEKPQLSNKRNHPANQTVVRRRNDLKTARSSTAVERFHLRFATEVRAMFVEECLVACAARRARHHKQAVAAGEEVQEVEAETYTPVVAKVIRRNVGWNASNANDCAELLAPELIKSLPPQFELDDEEPQTEVVEVAQPVAEEPAAPEEEEEAAPEVAEEPAADEPTPYEEPVEEEEPEAAAEEPAVEEPEVAEEEPVAEEPVEEEEPVVEEPVEEEAPAAAEDSHEEEVEEEEA